VKSQISFRVKITAFHFKPSQLAGVCCLFLNILILTSCGSFIVPGTSKTQNIFKGRFESISQADYSDHLASLKFAFLATPNVKIVSSKVSLSYLKNLTTEIISKNEIFFKELKEANVTILDIEAPIHFSLPKGEIFLSSGLIYKYIKHESMLVSILSYELVRSEKLLYPRQLIIPTGFINLERLLSLGRLQIEEKVEVHKWAHYLTIRSGHDGEYYLSWLQTQNRNTADFITQVGDVNLINREEFLFKAFLIKNATEDEEISVKKNSSKNFYVFINSIRNQYL
jgi:hypothetical protein